MTPQAVAEGTMGTAIQERLRHAAEKDYNSECEDKLREAADYIDSLEKQRDEARAKAIEECAEIARLQANYADKIFVDKWLQTTYELACGQAADAILALNGGDLREADAAIKEAGKS